MPGDGEAPARETPLAQWAAHILRHWLVTRSRLGIAGTHLFPSTLSRKPWSKVAQYLAVKQVIEASGLDPTLSAGGSFRLRHTFALRQLRRGQEDERVAHWLGVEPAEMARYKRVVFAPVIDVV